MELKSNLHMHVAGDPEDFIDYTLRDAIDAAEKLGFSVLAVTPHNSIIWDKPSFLYAQERGILLIRGIEKEIEGAHVVVLNVHDDIRAVKTLQDLTLYKKNHGESFIIAPHPFFPASYVLGEKLLAYREIFDAIEYSWFFSKNINFNIGAEKIAQEYAIPYIATSDTHNIRFLDAGYAVITADKKSPEKIFEAIRKHSFYNAVQPKKISALLCYTLGRYKTELWGLLKRK